MFAVEGFRKLVSDALKSKIWLETRDLVKSDHTRDLSPARLRSHAPTVNAGSLGLGLKVHKRFRSCAQRARYRSHERV